MCASYLTFSESSVHHGIDDWIDARVEPSGITRRHMNARINGALFFVINLTVNPFCCGCCPNEQRQGQFERNMFNINYYFVFTVTCSTHSTLFNSIQNRDYTLITLTSTDGRNKRVNMVQIVTEHSKRRMSARFLRVGIFDLAHTFGVFDGGGL